MERRLRRPILPLILLALLSRSRTRTAKMKFVSVPLSLFLLVGAAVAAPSSLSQERALARRNYTTNYADQLTDGTACRDVTVIWARGTGQQGNIGEPTDVGPLFLDDLAAIVGTNNLAAQGVDYSASVDGFEEGGDPAGSALMANLTAQVCVLMSELKTTTYLVPT